MEESMEKKTFEVAGSGGILAGTVSEVVKNDTCVALRLDVADGHTYQSAPVAFAKLIEFCKAMYDGANFTCTPMAFKNYGNYGSYAVSWVAVKNT